MSQKSTEMQKKSKASKSVTEEQRELDQEIEDLVSSLKRQNQLLTEKIRELMMESQKNQTKENQQ